MKRVIIASSSDQFAIGVFDGKNQFIGYLFDYVETKGHSIVRCATSEKKAQLFDSETRVKRAYSYYQHFSEIYVYDRSTVPSHKYKMFKKGIDPSSFNTSECTYHSIQGCYLKVISMTEEVAS